jgi:predicted RNA-binding protein with PUA-like domain
MAAKYWLLKSEPGCYSIDDLAGEPDQTTNWSGVRNFQARNYLRDQMSVGDLALFYHSGTTPSSLGPSSLGPSAVGVVRIVRAGHPDETALDPGDSHFDPRSKPEKPLWYAVDVRFERKFATPVPLRAMRVVPALSAMELLRKGSRLSVTPVGRAEFEVICRMAEAAKVAGSV